MVAQRNGHWFHAACTRKMRRARAEGQCPLCRKQDANVVPCEVGRGFGADQLSYELAGQMEDTERVFESGMACTRVDEEDVSQLGDVAETLIVFGINDIDQILRDGDVTPDRIADVFPCVEEAQIEHGSGLMRRRLAGAKMLGLTLRFDKMLVGTVQAG